MWCVTEMTEEYIKRMLDVLEVYERPYNPLYPVVCFDEKSKQLLDKPRKSIAAKPKPGSLKKVDYEYRRNGTVNIFVAVEPKGKKRHLFVTKHRKKGDFAKAIKRLVMGKYKSAEKVVLVTDNLNIHSEKVLREIFNNEEAEKIINRIEWHYTPKHASWLNMAEIEINVLSRQCLSREIPAFQGMQKHTAKWSMNRNEMNIGINWQFTRKKAKIKFKLKFSKHNIHKI